MLPAGGAEQSSLCPSSRETGEHSDGPELVDCLHLHLWADTAVAAAGSISPSGSWKMPVLRAADQSGGWFVLLHCQNPTSHKQCSGSTIYSHSLLVQTGTLKPFPVHNHAKGRALLKHWPWPWGAGILSPVLIPRQLSRRGRWLRAPRAAVPSPGIT